MKCIQSIFDTIAVDAFKPSTLRTIEEYTNDIENGATDFPRFNQQEHAGLCKAGAPLIGVSTIACYAARSLATRGNAASDQGESTVKHMGLAETDANTVFIDFTMFLTSLRAELERRKSGGRAYLERRNAI